MGPCPRLLPPLILVLALIGPRVSPASASWPLDSPVLATADSAQIASLRAVEAALDTLDGARWDFVAGIQDGSFARLRRTSDARERASDTLSRMLLDEALLSHLSWPERRRWLQLALSEHRRDWLRPLLRTAPELPLPGDAERGGSALATGIAALRLLEEDPEEDSAFLEADPARPLDSLAVRSLKAAANEPLLLRDEAMYRLAVRAEAEGDTSAALAWADSIVLHAPESCRAPAARALRARSRLAEGRAALAEEEALRGLEQEPAPELRFLAAQAAAAQGRTREAALGLEDLILAAPTDRLAASAYRLRIELGRNDSTLAMPDRDRIPLLLALLGNPVLDAEGELVALADTPGIDTPVQREASLELAKAQYRRKRYEPAVARLRTLRDAPEPEMAEEARLYLARIHRNLGNLEPMTREYRTLLDAEGEQAATAAWELGRELESLGRWEEAVAAYSGLLRRHPADGRRRDALFRRGFDRFRAGDRDAALGDFRECLRLSSMPADREQAAFWTYRMLLESGRDAEASAEAQAAAGESWPAEAYGVLLRERLKTSSVPAPAPERAGEPASSVAPGVPAVSLRNARAFERGAAFLALGDADAARAELRPVTSSSSVGVLDTLARIAAGYGLYPEGVLWANKALRATASRDPRAESLRRLAYPAAHAGHVIPAARREGLDPALIWALMRQESLYDSRAVSRAGALGLMQLMPATLARMNADDGETPLPSELLFHPGVNVAYGTRFLADRLAEFQGRLYPTLAGYNAGERKAREWLDRSDGDADAMYIESIGYVETYSYVRRIIWLRWMYHSLYVEDDGDASPKE